MAYMDTKNIQYLISFAGVGNCRCLREDVVDILNKKRSVKLTKCKNIPAYFPPMFQVDNSNKAINLEKRVLCMFLSN